MFEELFSKSVLMKEVLPLYLEMYKEISKPLGEPLHFLCRYVQMSISLADWLTTRAIFES